MCMQMVFDNVGVYESIWKTGVCRKKRGLKTKAQVNATLSSSAEEEEPSEWTEHRQPRSRRKTKGGKMLKNEKVVSYFKSCWEAKLDEDRRITGFWQSIRHWWFWKDPFHSGTDSLLSPVQNENVVPLVQMDKMAIKGTKIWNIFLSSVYSL